MPWSETTPMRERVKLVAAFCDGLFSMTELAQLHGVSRKTGYKWVERFEQEGPEGLQDRSRAPRSSPNRTPEEIVEGLLEMRRQHPRWGPKKLIAWLEDHRSGQAWPAASTAGEILKRHGLVRGRPFRRRIEHPGRTLYPVLEPNDLWTADFKGQFRTGDARYCYPLTAADCLSRYLLGCQALRSSATQKSQEIFERLFRQYGLPRAIRTDNGAPFASIAIGRLSTLSVWWIRLGILPVLIEPSHPEQNASHERMHRTLKEETARPPQANLAAQQRRFDRFRREYNEQRPHESLGQRPPASLYRPSPRPYPKRLPPLEYPGHFEIRHVGSNGCISWNAQWLHLTQALADQDVGLEEIHEGVWSIHFGPMLLGRFHQGEARLRGVRA
jgi:putative transposase